MRKPVETEYRPVRLLVQIQDNGTWTAKIPSLSDEPFTRSTRRLAIDAARYGHEETSSAPTWWKNA